MQKTMNYKWNIEFENVGLVYPNGKEALKNINLRIDEGEMLAIIGLSGAGKTTLLKTINKLQDITSGSLYVGDRSKEAIANFEKKKEKFRNESEKLKSFLETHELNQKIVDSFIKDLHKETEYRDSVVKKVQKEIDEIKAEILSLEKDFNKALENFSKGVAAPYKIQIREKTFDLKLLELKLKLKQRQYEKVKKHNDNTIKLCKKWDENTKHINKELIKRLKQRLNIFKQDYLQAKVDRPYYQVEKLNGKVARRYKSNIGMVFQRYNLIYKASVLNNALSGRLSKMPWWRAITGLWSRKDKRIAFQALADVNILEVAYARAEDLSGGQMQRVALARTITQGARLFLADEPVGALDPIMAKSVMDSFLEINQKTGKTVIMNLHHVDLALTYADRIIGIKEGEIVYDGPSTKINLEILKTIYGDTLEGFDAHELKEIMRKRQKVKG